MEFMRQVEIKCGNVHEVCWVDDHPKLNVGSEITLKDEADGKRWKVISATYCCVDKKSLYKPWHVGGL